MPLSLINMHILMQFQTRIKASSKDATKMSHTHERIETKKNELVYIRLKVSRVVYHSHLAHKINIHMPTIVLRNQRELTSLAIQSRAQNKIHG